MPLFAVTADLRLMDALQHERLRRGGLPLVRNVELDKAAQFMADDLVSRSGLSHTDSQGRSLGDRIAAFKYQNYSLVSENLVSGVNSVEQAIQLWLNSPGHRTNMLAGEVNEVGLGVAPARQGFVMVTVFGARRGVVNVALARRGKEIFAYPLGQAGGELRWRVNEGEWSGWTPATPAYRLPVRLGEITVELRSSSLFATAKASF
jgi:hypothetical protein